MATNPPELPDGILVEIFSRLPTKSVGKCRCLSKSWRTDLSSTHFINKHLISRQQTTNQEEKLALITVFRSLHIVTSPLKHNEQHVKILTGVPKVWSTQLGGACNGLVLLLAEDQGMNPFLMNPITLHQVKIGKPPPARKYFSGWGCSLVYGFGYDSYTDDFKVIALHCFFPHVYNYDQDVRKPFTLVDVFSVNKGAWNRLHTSSIFTYGEFIPQHRTHGVFVNGHVHWFITIRDAGCYGRVVAFDLAKEVFHEIHVPAEFYENRPEVVRMSKVSGVVVIRGCLSIVHNLINRDTSGGTDVWMMKEYGVAESWVRFHIAGDDFEVPIMPLCLVEDDQLMCYTESNVLRNALVVCDLKDGTRKKVILSGEDHCYWVGISFVDSLVSPGRKCGRDNDSG